MPAPPSQRTTWFVDECSKRLGPKSGSGKLLIVDGLVSSMPKETIECFDYYILQTYALTAQSSLDSYRLAGLVNAFGDIIDEETITNRTLVTENFEPEAMWKYGGTSCRLPDGTYTNSLQAMALWQPANGFRKRAASALIRCRTTSRTIVTSISVPPSTPWTSWKRAERKLTTSNNKNRMRL